MKVSQLEAPSQQAKPEEIIKCKGNVKHALPLTPKTGDCELWPNHNVKKIQVLKSDFLFILTASGFISLLSTILKRN